MHATLQSPSPRRHCVGRKAGKFLIVILVTVGIAFLVARSKERNSTRPKLRLMMEGARGSVAQQGEGRAKAGGLNLVRNRPVSGRSDRTEPDSEFALVRNLVISESAVRAANLSGDEKAYLQRHFDELYNGIKKIFEERMEVDPLRHDPENGVCALRIKAFQMQGTRFLGEFERDLRSRFGEKRGALLFGGLSYHDFFGAFGENDTFIQLSVDGNGAVKAQFQEREPGSGKLVTGGDFFLDQIQERFGNVFEENLRLITDPAE